MRSDAEICSNVLKSLLLNSLALMSIYFFDLLLVPLAQGEGQTKWLHRNVGWFYQILWLLPVLGVSFYLNVRVRSQNQSRLCVTALEAFSNMTSSLSSYKTHSSFLILSY